MSSIVTRWLDVVIVLTFWSVSPQLLKDRLYVFDGISVARCDLSASVLDIITTTNHTSTVTPSSRNYFVFCLEDLLGTTTPSSRNHALVATSTQFYWCSLKAFSLESDQLSLAPLPFLHGSGRYVSFCSWMSHKVGVLVCCSG